MTWMPRAISQILRLADLSMVDVRSFKAFTDGSGAPAVLAVTGYVFALDYLGEYTCNLIGSPSTSSRMASEGACRRAKAAYKKLVDGLLSAEWMELNRAMYPEVGS